jgi:hypothetical protein
MAKRVKWYYPQISVIWCELVVKKEIDMYISDLSVKIKNNEEKS